MWLFLLMVKIMVVKICNEIVMVDVIWSWNVRIVQGMLKRLTANKTS
jgi:hypothetical protein